MGVDLPIWLSGLLVCPKCRAELRQDPEGYRCAEDHFWPISAGIPRFVDDQRYAATFGLQWNRFASTQLDDPTARTSESTFREKTGLRPEDVKDRLVLDVGCGMGRFSDVVSRWGAKVVAVDLSDAVVAARHNLQGRSDVAVLQADVFGLPFEDEVFDVVFSLGVLHHTPDTREAFSRLPRHVKRGGRLAVWVYSDELLQTHRGAEVLRRITTKIPDSRLLPLIQRADPVVRALHQIPWLGSRMKRVVPWAELGTREERVLGAFDWYSPRFQWKHTYEEVELWFRDEGLGSIERLPFPVAVSGVRLSDD